MAEFNPFGPQRRRRERGGAFEQLAQASIKQSIAGQRATTLVAPPPPPDNLPATLTPSLTAVTLQLPQT